jgi:hypothetical protein
VDAGQFSLEGLLFDRGGDTVEWLEVGFGMLVTQVLILGSYGVFSVYIG